MGIIIRVYNGNFQLFFFWCGRWTCLWFVINIPRRSLMQIEYLIFSLLSHLSSTLFPLFQLGRMGNVEDRWDKENVIRKWGVPRSFNNAQGKKRGRDPFELNCIFQKILTIRSSNITATFVYWNPCIICDTDTVEITEPYANESKFTEISRGSSRPNVLALLLHYECVWLTVLAASFWIHQAIT